MKRRAFNLFCLFSLLIFCASVALWVRSYFVGEEISWSTRCASSSQQLAQTRYVGAEIFWARGTFQMVQSEMEYPRAILQEGGWGYDSWEPTSSMGYGSSRNDRIYFGLGDFELVDGVWQQPDRRVHYRALTVPLWVFLPFALPPILWWRNRKKSRGCGFPIEAAGAPAAEVKPAAESV